MPVVLNDQVSHTYGVLDPLVHERFDTRFVYAGLDTDTRNVVVLPQGGYRDRGGSKRKGRARRILSAVDLSSATLAAPNGGTPGNLIDGDDQTNLTTSAASGDPFVLVTIDLGTAVEISAVDLTGFQSDTAGADDALALQYFDGSSWTTFGSTMGIRTFARSRRFATAPGLSVTAQQWRIAVVGGSAVGAVTITGLAMQQETATLAQGRLFRAGRSDIIFYQLVVTPGNIDIWQNGVFRASCASAVTDAMIPALKVSSAYDTVLFFHVDLQPERIIRQGFDDEWNFDHVPFENIPQVDYGGAYDNEVDAEQEITLSGVSNDQDFELTLEGNGTAPITYSSTAGTTASRIKTALEALTTVDPGLTVTSQSSTRFTVTFTGGRNSGRAWATMTGTALDNPATGFVTARTMVAGQPGGEDIMSAARGWPAVGRYAQSRLVLGGFPERPLNVLASVTAEPFNLDVERAGATAALMFTLDDDEESAIRDLLFRRSLMVFTASGVWYNAVEALSADEAPNFLKSDAPGIDAKTRPMSLSNAIQYVHSGGHSLIQLTFSELEQDFIGEPASVLSAVLVDAPQDMTIRRANQENDSDVLWYVNADGGLRSVTLMRTQDVSGFGPHETDGAYRSMLNTSDSTLWQLVERTTANGLELVLEVVDETCSLDSGITGTNDPASPTLSGLEIYEGLSLAVMSAGQYLGHHTVNAGAITLPVPVASWVAGYWTAPRATDLPFRKDSEVERPMARLKRVFKASVSVLNTTSVALAVNGGETFPLSLQRHDEVQLDTPVSAFTGILHAEGMPGWTEEAQVTVTQIVPGKLTVRGVRKSVVL